MSNFNKYMQHYIGVKHLEAVPMTRGKYNAYRGWIIPTNEDPTDEGYFVRYNDAYESWSPKGEFEKAYFAMGDDPSKVTQDMVNRFLGKRISTARIDDRTTMVISETVTGFRQHEVSSCCDAKNYDEATGKEICINRMKNTLWQCLGFVLAWAKNGISKEE